MGTLGWVSDPLDELRSVANSLLTSTNVDVIDIGVSDTDRNGFERRLRLRVERNQQEGENESA